MPSVEARSRRPAGSLALLLAIVVPVGLAVVDSGLAGASLRAVFGLPMRIAALAFGLALVVAALGSGGPRRAPGWTRGELAAVIAATAVALALRAWQLDALRVLVDEGNSIDNLFRAYEPATSLLLPPSQYVTTMLHPSWQAAVVALVGGSLPGLRLSSAVLGALTVPALWLLARALFDRGTGLIAAMVLAVLPVHLHFSRIGLPHVMDALFGTLALAGVAHGLCGGRRMAWAVGGVALGLTHYGFEAGRWFFTPLVVAWLAVMAVLAPHRWRAARSGLARGVAACVLTVLPLYGTLVGAAGEVGPRLRASALSTDELRAQLANPAAVRERLRLAAAVLVSERERADYYGGDDGLVPPLLVPFAVLGIGLALRRPSAPAVLLPLWIAAAWLANVLMRDPAVSARWVVVFPALALASARGVHAVAEWLSAPTAPRADRGPTIAAAVLVIGVSVVLLREYFGEHIERLAAQARAAKPYADGYDAGLRAAAMRSGGAVLVITDPPVDVHPVRSLLRLLSDGRDAWRFDERTPAQADAAYLAALPDDRDHLFFIAPGDRDTLSRLAHCFPLDGPVPNQRPPAPDKRLELYLAAAGSRRPMCAD
jgi:hypothetical protein